VRSLYKVDLFDGRGGKEDCAAIADAQQRFARSAKCEGRDVNRRGTCINAAFTSDADRADKARSAQSGELEVFQQENRDGFERAVRAFHVVYARSVTNVQSSTCKRKFAIPKNFILNAELLIGQKCDLVNRTIADIGTWDY